MMTNYQPYYIFINRTQVAPPESFAERLAFSEDFGAARMVRIGLEMILPFAAIVAIFALIVK